MGIIAADKCITNKTTNYKNCWNKDHGYSYWCISGQLYHRSVNGAKDYGDPYDEGDIIDIWLDLRDDKRELSYAKNDKTYGKAYDVKESTEYRLCVTVYGKKCKIELLSFEFY